MFAQSGQTFLSIKFVFLIFLCYNLGARENGKERVNTMPSKKLDFKTGQYVVYPTQGVGKLARTEEQVIAGQKIKMLVIDFEKSRMTLRVPLERAEISGLRPLTSAKKMDEAIASAKGKAGAKRMIWARRAAQYEENINSGDPMKLAEVVRDLQRRNAADTIPFSARRLYMRALERMAQEFAVLHKMEVEEASEKIEDILGVPKEIDLNAVEEDEEEQFAESPEE
jgi:CarD family transcriptional regulator